MRARAKQALTLGLSAGSLALCASGSGTALAATTDFSSVEVLFAAPGTYDHRVGGGAYNTGVVSETGDVAIAIPGQSYACGDTVTYLVAIKVKAAPATANQTLEFDLAMQADTQTISGAGFIDVTSVRVNYGAVVNGRGPGGIDAGMSDDGGSLATLVSKTFQYASGAAAPGPYVAGSRLVSKIRLSDLEANERVIVRVDGTIGCKAAISPPGTGDLLSTITNVHGYSPSYGAVTTTFGNRYLTFTSAQNLAGAIAPNPVVKKTVTTSDGACPGYDHLGAFVGDTVKYCYEVSNPSTVDLRNVLFVDDNGTPTDPSDDVNVSLAGLVDKDGIGGRNDLAASTTVTGQMLGVADLRSGHELINIATVSGVGASGLPYSASATAKVLVYVRPASLALAVKASLDDVCGNADDADPITVASGTPVRFCYAITSTGASTVTGITVADPGFVVPGVITLGAGQTGYLISNPTVAVSNFSDSAVATGLSSNASVVSNRDSASVIVPADQLGITVTVSLDPTCDDGDGHLVTVLPSTTVYYCYRVQNGGQTDLSSITVNDPLVTVPGFVDLTPGGSYTFMSPPVIASDDGAHVATALGIDPFGLLVPSQPDRAAVDVVHPALTIQKTASLDGTCPGSELVTTLVGQSVTWCYTVTNNGDTTIDGVTVNDTGASLTAGSLPPGASLTVPSTFAASVDLTTAATASGTDRTTGTGVTSAPDGAGVDVVHPALSIATTVSLDGTCPGDEVVNVLTGTSVTWCYTVKNTGDVAVNGITASDDHLGAVPGTAFALAVGESTTLSRPDTAGDDLTLLGLASGVDAVIGHPVTSNRDPAVVNVVRPVLDLDVTVSLDGTCPGADSLTVAAGSNVVTCYTVKNPGDDPLYDIAVVDQNGNPIGTIDALLGGGVAVLAGPSLPVDGDVVNLGDATGTDPFGFPASDQDTALVKAIFAHLAIEKTVSLDGTCPGSELVFALPGQDVTTCYTVKNTGDLPVNGVTVVDGGVSTPAGDLPPGGSVTVHVTTPATDDSNSPAVASGSNGSTGAPVDSRPDTAAIDVVHPALVVQKTVSLDGTCPGAELVQTLENQMVTFCYAVTNTGDTAVSGIVVNDHGALLRVDNLGPGESSAVATTRVVTDDNDTLAIASGTTTATGTNVASPPDGAAVDVIHPALSLATTISTDGTCPGSELVTVLTGTNVVWCYTVTNTGDVPVAGITASDDTLGPVPATAVSLGVGESHTFIRSESASIDRALLGVSTGTDTVVGSPVQSNQDPAALDVVHPAVAIDVTVSTNGQCPGQDSVSVAAGTAVTPCYVVTNPGDDTLVNVAVHDGAGALIGTLASLAPGASSTLTGGVFTVQTDAAPIGTAAGADTHGFPVTSTDAAAVHPLFAHLEIHKTVSLDSSCPGVELVTVLSGQAVTTCYTVVNTGDVPVSSVIIDDDGHSIPVGDLAPGQSLSVATSDSASDDSNTAAVASGLNGANGAPVVSDPDAAAVDVVHPALAIAKTVSLSGTCPGVEQVSTLAGASVTWCYTVTNTGDTTVDAITVNDAGAHPAIGTLAPGQSASASVSFIAVDDRSTLAVAAGTDGATGGPVQSAPDGAAVDVIHPSLSIATTVSINGACPGEEVVNVLPGTTITWCYAVTNTGDVAVNAISVTDNHVGEVHAPSGTLAAGETVTFSLADTATSDLTVNASAAGIDAVAGSAVQSNQDPAVVNVVHPNIDIDVTVSTTGQCPGEDSLTIASGAQVTNCYAVANLGDDTLTDVIVKDNTGAVLGTIASLAPGETYLFANPAHAVLNDTSVPGNVTALDTYGYPVADNDTALITALFAGLQIQKTASLDGTCPGAETVQTLEGKTVTYCYTVTNSGQIAVSGIAVSDHGTYIPVGSLAPGQSASVSGSIVATVDTDTPAVATGINALTSSPVASPPDGALVDVVHPSLAIVKTASLDGTCPGAEAVHTLSGATVTYCYTVTNTGDTAVGGVTLIDDRAMIAIGSLAAGQSADATGTLVATVDTDTAAVASGVVPATSTSVQSPPDDALVDVVHPALTLSTTASLNGSCPGVEVVNILAGTNVTWCYTVTNSGDTTVGGVTVTDLRTGVVPGAPVTLAAGQSFAFSASGPINVDTTEIGIANGTALLVDAPVQSNQDPAVANVVNPSVDIDVTVATNGTCPGVDSVTVAAGSSVTTCYKVSNLGDDTLTNLVVKDDHGAVLGVIPTLEPGASQIFSGVSGAIVADATVYGIVNATDVYGFPVTDNDTALVHPLLADLALKKTAPAKVTAPSNAPLAYTITVQNLGPGTAAQPVVTDTLPTSLTYVSASTSSGSCAFATGKVTCTLASLAAGGTATITINTTTNGVFGTITNTATVTSATPDPNLGNNTDTASTFYGTGATRTIGFYANHPEVITQCLAARGGLIDLGFVKLRSELHDDEIDVDVDTRVETGLLFSLGMLKANIAKYSNGVKRSPLAQARMQAGQQMVAAICNSTLTGAGPSFNLDGAVAILAGTDVAAILSINSQADAFNNSKDAVNTGWTFGSANAKAAFDDPTDPND